MDKTLEELIAHAKTLPPMTEDQKEDQAIGFAYGNLACTANHKPKRNSFAVACEKRGWSQERFDKWANSKQWWD